MLKVIELLGSAVASGANYTMLDISIDPAHSPPLLYKQLIYNA